MKKISAVALAFFLFFPLFAFGDVVVLKSGERVEGEIIETTADHVKVVIGESSITYFTDEIQSIQKTAPLDTGRSYTLSDEYINEFYGLAFSGPATWKKYENYDMPLIGNAIVVYFLDEGSFAPCIALSAEAVFIYPEAETIMDFSQATAKRLQDSGATILQWPQSTQAAGQNAMVMRLTLPIKNNGHDVHAIWYQIMRDQIVYTLSFADDISVFENRRVMFEDIARSFHFLPRYVPQ